MADGASIRIFRPEDAAAVAQITSAAIRQTATSAYSAEQVAAWASVEPDAARFLERVAGGALILVAVEAPEDTPLAYTLIEPDGHLDMLYCHPAQGGRGLARQLLEAAAAGALARGLDRLFTKASELARTVFERAGYSLLHRRDFTIPFEGREVAIHNYAMEKRLA